mgnify:CR=1 FL=1
MDAATLKTFVDEHPEGVAIQMADGKVFRIPHRDFIWFVPSLGQRRSKVRQYSPAFWLHDVDEETNRLVNSAFVRDVTPLNKYGHVGKRAATRAKR